jgi:hypothetical protein
VYNFENSCNTTLFLDNHDEPSPELDCLCSEKNVDLWSYLNDCVCYQGHTPFYWQEKFCSNVSVPTGTPSLFVDFSVPTESPSLFLEFYPIKASTEISSTSSTHSPGSITLRTIPITRRTKSALSGVQTSPTLSSTITEFIPRPTLSTSNILATALLLLDSNGAAVNSQSLSMMASTLSGLQVATNAPSGNNQNGTKNVAPLLDNPKPMLLLAIFAML